MQREGQVSASRSSLGGPHPNALRFAPRDPLERRTGTRRVRTYAFTRSHRIFITTGSAGCDIIGGISRTILAISSKAEHAFPARSLTPLPPSASERLIAKPQRRASCCRTKRCALALRRATVANANGALRATSLASSHPRLSRHLPKKVIFTLAGSLFQDSTAIVQHTPCCTAMLDFPTPMGIASRTNDHTHVLIVGKGYQRSMRREHEFLLFDSGSG